MTVSAELIARLFDACVPIVRELIVQDVDIQAIVRELIAQESGTTPTDTDSQAELQGNIDAGLDAGAEWRRTHPRRRT